jgi:hypothetical protein
VKYLYEYFRTLVGDVGCSSLVAIWRRRRMTMMMMMVVVVMVDCRLGPPLRESAVDKWEREK